jgi:hypothetical protein
MNTDDIIRMAKEAGFDKNSLGTTFTHGKLDESLEKFANLVAAAVMPKEALAEMFEWGKDAGRREEREACAKLCDGWPDYNVQGLAEAIRARGQK